MLEVYNLNMSTIFIFTHKVIINLFLLYISDILYKFGSRPCVKQFEHIIFREKEQHQQEAFRERRHLHVCDV